MRALVALGRKPRYSEIARFIVDIEPLLWDYVAVLLQDVEEDWRRVVAHAATKINLRDIPFNLKGRSKETV